jgi:hypothetical protein
MALEIPEDLTHQQKAAMINKLLMIALYAIPTVILLISAYFFTKKS